MTDLREEIEKIREELQKELLVTDSYKLNDEKLMEISKRLDEVISQYITTG